MAASNANAKKRKKPLLNPKTLERKAKSKKKLGRPSDLTANIYHAIVHLSAQGKTKQEIADTLGFPRSTINYWTFVNENLKHDIHMAKSLADEAVELALFQSAVGFSHPEEKVFMTKGGRIVTHETIKQYAPSVDACKYWLNNRKPKQWSNKEKLPDSGNLTIALAYNPNQRLVKEENNGPTAEESSASANRGNEYNDAEVDL